MILDEFKGNILRETPLKAHGLPIYCVQPAKGMRKYFGGETGYMDAQRYFNDVNLRMIYK